MFLKITPKFTQDFSLSTWIEALRFYIGKYCIQRNRGMQQMYKLCILINARNVKEKDDIHL